MIVRVGLLRRICVGDMWRHEDNPHATTVAEANHNPHVAVGDWMAPIVEGYGDVEVRRRYWSGDELVLTGVAKELGKVGPVEEVQPEQAPKRRGATR